VVLLDDTSVCYLLTLFHSARLFYTNIMTDFFTGGDLGGNKRHYEVCGLFSGIYCFRSTEI